MAGLLAFNLSNPDARIASSAVERFERTGRIDAGYVGTLSTDALPALMALPHDARECMTHAIVDPLYDAGPWTSFNSSRQAALRLPIQEDTGCIY